MNKLKSKNISIREESEPVVMETETETVDFKMPKGIVNVDTCLNIREEASTKSNVICKINNGDKVEILDSTDNNFYLVELKNGIIGYAMKKFIEVSLED